MSRRDSGSRYVQWVMKTYSKEYPKTAKSKLINYRKDLQNEAKRGFKTDRDGNSIKTTINSINSALKRLR